MLPPTSLIPIWPIKRLKEGQEGFVSGQTFLAYLLIGWFGQFIFSFCIRFAERISTPVQYLVSSATIFCILWFVGSGGYFVGMLAGFLFGFPKASTGKADGSVSGTTTVTRNDRTRENTNLEDISDWLTKIIVGLGLANFRSIFDYTDRFGTYVNAAIAGAYPPERSGYIIAIASALYGFACGFLFFYIWARSEFAKILNPTLT